MNWLYFGGWRSKGQDHVALHCFERNISGMHKANFFTCGTNIHVDSRMTWIEFCGHRSKVNVTVTSHFFCLVNAISQERLQGIVSHLVQTFTWGWISFWLPRVKGQGHCGLTDCVYVFSWTWYLTIGWRECLHLPQMFTIGGQRSWSQWPHVIVKATTAWREFHYIGHNSLRLTD